VRKNFADCVERYGEKRARQLRRMMYAEYKRASLIDTGAYDVAGCLPESRGFADELGLEHNLVGGSLQLLERLFDEPCDGEIVVVPPGESVSLLHLVAP